MAAADIIIEAESSGNTIVLENASKEIGRLGVGDFFGEMSALLPPSLAAYRRRSRTAFACAETHLGMLSHEDIIELCAKRPQIAEKVIPYINAIAKKLPPTPLRRTLSTVSATSSARSGSGSSSPNPNQQPGQPGQGQARDPDAAVLSMSDVHPVLRLLEPRLEAFDEKLGAMDEQQKAILTKLDQLLAKR